MAIFNKIKYELSELEKDIRFFLDIDKPNFNDIPCMCIETDIEKSIPVAQLSYKNIGRRIIYRR